MSRYEIKDRAKAQLGRSIFGANWLVALAVCFISSVICGVVGNFVPALGAIILSGPFGYGLCYLFLKQTRDGCQMQVQDLFKGFTDAFLDSVLIGLLTAIFTLLWSLLFIIPGIVKSYSYSMAYYVKIDNPDYDALQCINESRRIMDGHKLELFVLDLSFIGWLIVGILCVGVGTLWVTPYMSAARSQFYESIKYHA